MPWTQIGSGRVDARSLWTPELSLDLMERDWNIFTVPFDFRMDTIVLGPAPDSQGFTLKFAFPESWTRDLLFDSGMKLRLTLGFDLSKDAGVGTSMTVAFDTGGVTTAAITGATTSDYKYATKEYTTFPTGLTSEALTATLGTAASGTAGRSWGKGADCRMEVLY